MSGRRLFVIFDGLHGPEGPRFVEVEDERGAGVGSDVGIVWGDHVTADGLKALGPFVSAAEYDRLFGVVAEIAEMPCISWEDQRCDQVAGRVRCPTCRAREVAS